MTVSNAKMIAGKAFFARVEADMGHPVTDHIIDLFMDNAEELGFSDDECLEIGNAVYADKGLPPVAKWWT